MSAVALTILLAMAADSGETRAAGRAALDAWGQCVISAADKLEVSAEAADIVAEAALGGCQVEEAAFFSSLDSTLSYDTRERIVSLQRQRVRSSGLAQVVLIRARRHQPK